MSAGALARFQVRIGPNRAGPQGLLQPIADGVKLIFKEELIPAKSDKIIFILAPVITVIPALIITAVVPWGGTINLFGRQVALQSGRSQCGCALPDGGHLDLGLWNHPGRMVIKQQICHVGWAALYRPDDQL